MERSKPCEFMGIDRGKRFVPRNFGQRGFGCAATFIASEFYAIRRPKLPQQTAKKCLGKMTVERIIRDYTTAVALTPKPEEWHLIQEMRRECRSSSIYRWPPHINILYPFTASALLENVESPILSRMALSVIDLAAFDIRLKHLHVFKHKRSATLVACPETRLVGQRNSLTERWNDFQSPQNACNILHNCLERTLEDESVVNSHFRPHMSIARFRSIHHAVGWMNEFRPRLETDPFVFRVDAVFVLSRTEHSPFQHRYEIRLSNTEGPRVRDASVPAYAHPPISVLYPDEYRELQENAPLRGQSMRRRAASRQFGRPPPSSRMQQEM